MAPICEFLLAHSEGPRPWKPLSGKRAEHTCEFSVSECSMTTVTAEVRLDVFRSFRWSRSIHHVLVQFCPVCCGCQCRSVALVRATPYRDGDPRTAQSLPLATAAAQTHPLLVYCSPAGQHHGLCVRVSAEIPQ